VGSRRFVNARQRIAGLKIRKNYRHDRTPEFYFSAAHSSGRGWARSCLIRWRQLTAGWLDSKNKHNARWARVFFCFFAARVNLASNKLRLVIRKSRAGWGTLLLRDCRDRYMGSNS
jgi:hypothetical protein